MLVFHAQRTTSRVLDHSCWRASHGFMLEKCLLEKYLTYLLQWDFQADASSSLQLFCQVDQHTSIHSGVPDSRKYIPITSRRKPYFSSHIATTLTWATIPETATALTRALSTARSREALLLQLPLTEIIRARGVARHWRNGTAASPLRKKRTFTQDQVFLSKDNHPAHH